MNVTCTSMPIRNSDAAAREAMSSWSVPTSSTVTHAAMRRAPRDSTAMASATGVTSIMSVARKLAVPQPRLVASGRRSIASSAVKPLVTQRPNPASATESAAPSRPASNQRLLATAGRREAAHSVPMPSSSRRAWMM
jgi:hypothetical protein